MVKVMTIVGARPELIRLSGVLARGPRKRIRPAWRVRSRCLTCQFCQRCR